MSIFENFFQKLFGKRGNSENPNQGFEDHRRYGDRFRNPIWQTDDDDDDDDNDGEAGDFRHPGMGMRFNVFTDPIEITRFFESQMDGMLKDFFHGFARGFGDVIVPFDDHGAIPAITLPESTPENLRDNVLKPGYENPPAVGSKLPKLDIDLDGKITAGELSEVWKEPEALPGTPMVQPIVPRQNISIRTFGQSMSSQVIRRPDGSIEQRQTVTDSEGNTETTVTRQIGDKTHTVKTRRDKNGVETKTEDFVNIDQSELMELEKRWKPVEEPRFEPGTLNQFPWHKFFSFNPKL